MARIAIGGFQHETNTFAPAKATYGDFEMADGWPGLTRGGAVLEEIRGMNLPLAGFVERASARGHDLRPTLWCSAAPSGPVEEEAYERIARELLERIVAVGPIDGIYLDLHGAMVTEHLEDGEGELLARLRRLVGSRIPIVVSLDLHANITARMMANASVLVVCQTYPHVDLFQSGEWASMMLDRLIQRGPLHGAMRRGDFLVPLTWQCTLIEPAAGLYRLVTQLEPCGPGSASFAFGFPAADIGECGPAVLVYAEDRGRAEETADRLIDAFHGQERNFAGRVWSPEEAVAYAMAKGGSATRPVILADSQDNPGAGGSSDRVGLLAALVSAGAQRAIVANLSDPEAAAAAHQAGLGARLSLSIGGRHPGPGRGSFDGSFAVEALGDGRFTATGPFYRGNRMQLGPMALLRTGGVGVVVTSRKQQAADQAMLRHLGIEPGAEKILALKSSVHFRADFQDLAEEILIVAAPGANPIDHRELAYRRLRSGLRLMPMGEALRR
jgi:microcystin degradation protein MlrC